MVSAALNAGESAMTTAEGCAEETIRRLRLDPDYAADGFVLPLSGGECVIDTAAYGETRVIDILASMDNYYKRLRVTVTISGSNATVTGWEETN